MAIQTPLNQEQLIAQALGSAVGGIPGQGGMPAPTGMPGAPMMPGMDAQLIGQALGAPMPAVNPAQVASGAGGLFGPGSFGDWLQEVRAWEACVMEGRTDCGPKPTRENPLSPPTPTQPQPIGT